MPLCSQARASGFTVTASGLGNFIFVMGKISLHHQRGCRIERSRTIAGTQYANPDAPHPNAIPGWFPGLAAFHKAKSNGSFFL